MNKFIDVSDKIYLRGLNEKDLVRMTEWTNNQDITKHMVMGCVPDSDPIYCTWDSVEEAHEKLKKSDDIIFAIMYASKHIGIVGLYDINWIARHTELRIVIGETDYLGKGVGTSVVKAVIKYAFEKLNLNKVYLGVNADDERANKCYQKAGFVKEGVSRDYHFRNGKYYNSNSYSILRREWKND
jgi:RimJ/RimL family protein N-acetyltransferase